MTQAVVRLDAVAARALTEQIRGAVETTYSLLLEAWEQEAWRALGYASWTAYIDGEFEFSRQRSYQLLQAARVTRSLSTAVDTRDELHITEREARDLAPVLPRVVSDARANVETGMEPSAAIRGAVASARETIQRVRVPVDEESPSYGDGFSDENVPAREVEDDEFPPFDDLPDEVPASTPAPARVETEAERSARARQESIARESQRFAMAISYTAQIISNDLGRRRLAVEYDQHAAVNPFVVTREAIATAAENLRLLAEVWDR